MAIIIDKKNEVYLQKPLTSEDFSTRSFADHISKLIYLKTLHPNVNKNVIKEITTIHTFNPPSDDHFVENLVAIKGIK